MINERAEQGRLALFPITFFSIPLGLGGWAIATQKIEHVLSLPSFAARGILWLDILVFAAVLVLYAAKALLHADEVRRELRHPVKISFIPTVSIGILLMSVAFLDMHRGLSHALWVSGTILHAGLTLYIMREWICQEHFEISHMNPAWFIPVVGNMIIPLAGVPHAPLDVSWFFFSIGIILWVVLLTIVMYRMIFHRSIPDRLLPTLFILIAPPAVGFIAYVKLTGGLDATARILFFFAVFMLAFLATLATRLGRIRFFLSWWAYSFPVAALAIAGTLMGSLASNGFYTGLAVVLWILLSLLILLLSARTVVSMMQREICVEE
jgi:tellurite resistance protein